MTMLHDLYGFEDGEITEENWRDLLEIIESRKGEGDRCRQILTEKARMKKTFLTFNYADDIPRHDSRFFVGTLRIDQLVNSVDKAAIQGLEKAVGDSIGSLNDLEDALHQLFKKFSGVNCVTVGASFSPERVFIKTSKGKAQALFAKVLSGGVLAPEENQAVGCFILDRALSLADEFGFPFQVMIGARRPVPGASPPDYAISGFESGMISSFCPLFYSYNGVKFDIFLANRVQSHELTVVAKNYPNVYVSGYWWYTFYPTVIKEFLRERLQMLPRNKMNGFFSDAYVVEWSYAKACLVRLQLARVLAEMVGEGYFTEELARELAVDLLIRNPERLYMLGSGITL